MMGTGAIGQSFGLESNLSNLDGLREQLKMLDGENGGGADDGKEGLGDEIDGRHFDEFEQV